MSDAVAQLEALIPEQPANPLRPHQLEEYDKELTRLGAIQQGVDMEGRSAAFIHADRDAAAHKTRLIRKNLQQQVPRRIEEAERRDKVARLVKEVIATVIQPAMLPQSVMRRNPPGAVDAFMKRENSRPVKKAVAVVKRALFALDPETTDVDHANMEKFRPSGVTGANATFDPSAQISGMFGFAGISEDQWPLEPPQTTAIAQVKAAEAAPEKKKRVYTEAQKAEMRDRLARGRANKKAASEAAS